MENLNGQDVNPNQDTPSGVIHPIEPQQRVSPGKFKYKVLFVVSILFGIFVLYGLIGDVNTFTESFNRGSATILDLFGLVFLLSLLLGFISLSLITYSYIKNWTQTSRLTDICSLTIITIFILILVSVLFVYAMLIASGGLLLLIPGISSIIPFQAIHQVEEIIMGIYLLSFIGLVFSFTKEHKTNKIKISLLWLIVFAIALSWILPQFIVNSTENSKPLISPVTVTLVGSTAGWLTYNNPQIGLSFMYPPSWPAPSIPSAGTANPRIDIPNPNKNPNQEFLSIIIGQTGSDGMTCDDCVAVPFDEAVQSFGPYVGGFSPNYKVSQISLDGKTYTQFSNTLSGGWTASTTIFIPNDISPNNYAMIAGGGSVDLNTFYLIVGSFHFFTASTTALMPSNPINSSASTTTIVTQSSVVDCGNATYSTGPAESAAMIGSACMNTQLSMCQPATIAGSIQGVTRTITIVGPKGNNQCMVTQKISGSPNPSGNWQLNCLYDSSKSLSNQDMSACSN